MITCLPAHTWPYIICLPRLVTIKMFRETPVLKAQFSKIIMIHPIERGVSGRILTMKIMGKDGNGNDTSLSINSEYEIRRILHKKFLYSSAFIIETNSKHNNEDDFTLKGAGWGHGAGLCQIGALGMSLAGKTTEEIVFHYYKNTKLKEIYE